MTWQWLIHESYELSLDDDGRVKWNVGLQSLMGDPSWVMLWWEEESRQLGVCGYNNMRGFPVVQEPEGPEYWINPGEILAEMGITVEGTVSAEPQEWSSPIEEDPSIGYIPFSIIYYIEIPE